MKIRATITIFGLFTIATFLVLKYKHDIYNNISRFLFSSTKSHFYAKLALGQEINISYCGIDSLFNKGSYQYAYLINKQEPYVILPPDLFESTIKLYNDKRFSTKDLDRHSILVPESFALSITEHNSVLLNIRLNESCSDGHQQYSISLKR